MIKFCKKCNSEAEYNASGACRVCKKKGDAAYCIANSEKLKTAKAAYRLANRLANPDKEKVYSAAWRIANPDKMKAYKAAWRAANKEKIKASGAAYRMANRDKEKVRSAAYYAANTDKAKVANAVWKAANPEARRIQVQNRRALQRSNGGTLSRGLSAKLFKLQKGKCPCCKQPLGVNFHLDHVVPIALGGSNTDSNIQLLRQRCNHQKHAKHPIDFMQQKGYLL